MPAIVESGALVHVLAGVVEAEGQVAIVYPEREFVPPQVRAFVAAVVSWATAELPKGLSEGFRECAKSKAQRAAPAKKARSKPVRVRPRQNAPHNAQ